jgi:adenylate cyclase
MAESYKNIIDLVGKTRLNIDDSILKDLEDTQYILQKKVDKFEDNKIVFVFTEDDTDIEAGIYMYDVKIYLSDGRRDRLIRPSEFEVFVGVTHD